MIFIKKIRISPSWSPASTSHASSHRTHSSSHWASHSRTHHASSHHWSAHRSSHRSHSHAHSDTCHSNSHSSSKLNSNGNSSRMLIFIDKVNHDCINEGLLVVFILVCRNWAMLYAPYPITSSSKASLSITSTFIMGSVPKGTVKNIRSFQWGSFPPLWQVEERWYCPPR